MRLNREQVMEMPTIGYYSGLNGVEIKKISYEEFEIYCVSNAWAGKRHAHKLKLKYDHKGDIYFNLYGHRIPLSECLRCGI